jgi:hypothetical protein
VARCKRSYAVAALGGSGQSLKMREDGLAGDGGSRACVRCVSVGVAD